MKVLLFAAMFGALLFGPSEVGSQMTPNVVVIPELESIRDDCDFCDPKVVINVVPVPGTGWVANPAMMGTGMRWDPWQSKAGECSEICTPIKGCAGNGTPLFGYIGAGIQVCAVPVPPLNCVGSGVQCVGNSNLIWLDAECGKVGVGPNNAFEIFQFGVKVADVTVTGGCSNCDGAPFE